MIDQRASISMWRGANLAGLRGAMVATRAVITADSIGKCGMPLSPIFGLFRPSLAPVDFYTFILFHVNRKLPLWAMSTNT